MRFQLMSISFVISCFIFVSTSGCKKLESNHVYEITELKHTFLAAYKNATLGHANSMNDLYKSVDGFCSVVDLGRFLSSRDAWVTARRTFHMLQPFVRMGGNIENQINFEWNNVETRQINISYLEPTSGNPNSGIVANEAMYPDIHEYSVSHWDNPGSNDRTKGFQVIEFLLWVEDNSAIGGGTRIFYDFVSLNDQNERRRSLLDAVNAILRHDLSYDYHTSSFEDLILESSSQDFLQFVLSGLVKFIDYDIVDVAIDLPLNSMDQSLELSRFSENTMTELNTMLDAIEIIIDGGAYFNKHNNVFLVDVIELEDDDIGSRLSTAFQEARVVLSSVNGNFDNAIINERVKLESFREQMLIISDLLKKYASKVDVSL